MMLALMNAVRTRATSSGSERESLVLDMRAMPRSRYGFTVTVIFLEELVWYSALPT
jgi:hypothetical protein